MSSDLVLKVSTALAEDKAANEVLKAAQTAAKVSHLAQECAEETFLAATSTIARSVGVDFEDEELTAIVLKLIEG